MLTSLTRSHSHRPFLGDTEFPRKVRSFVVMSRKWPQTSTLFLDWNGYREMAHGRISPLLGGREGCRTWLWEENILKREFKQLG